jgi:hypothetical protein
MAIVKCIICKQIIIGHGHNPYPIGDKGRCCDDCNYSVVLPLRISRFKKWKLDDLRKKEIQGGEPMKVKPDFIYKQFFIWLGVILVIFSIALIIIINI